MEHLLGLIDVMPGHHILNMNVDMDMDMKMRQFEERVNMNEGNASEAHVFNLSIPGWPDLFSEALNLKGAWRNATQLVFASAIYLHPHQAFPLTFPCRLQFSHSTATAASTAAIIIFTFAKPSHLFPGSTP